MSSEHPQRPFRSEVIKFFCVGASAIVDGHGHRLCDQDLVFVLVGAFRSVTHTPFNSSCHRFVDEHGVCTRECTRAALLGKTVVKLPPNHVKVVQNWVAQRFVVLSLTDLKSTIHVIPLTRADGTPLHARFAADDSMPATLPAMAKEKQLHLLNENIYI